MTVTVNLTEDRGREVNVVAWLFTGIAIAAVALKLFTRSQIVKVVGLDDFFIFLSLAFSIIASAFVSYSVQLGLGRHTAAVLAEFGAEHLVLTAKWQVLGYPFNIGAFSFPNLSIAILVSRLLDPNPIRSRFLYALVTFQVIFAIVSVFILFLMCQPVQFLWDTSIEGGTCWSPDVLNDYSYWLSSYTTVTDIILAVVPISIFWKLQMPKSTKLGVCIMMGLTLLSAVVTIVKATYLHLFTDRTDPLFNVVPLVIWGLVEQNVVIIAACVPTLRPFFHTAFRSQNKSSPSDVYHPSSGYQLSSRSKSRVRGDLDTQIDDLDTQSHNSQQGIITAQKDGIWRTQDFTIVECENDLESGKRKRVVPDALKD